MKEKIQNWLKKRVILLKISRSLYGKIIWIDRRVRGGAKYLITRREYKRKNVDKRFLLKHGYRNPCYFDFFENAGSQTCYFWQDLWAARLIHQNNPETHYDIGSRIDGFIAHLASFRNQIVLIDVRPIGTDIPGVEFVQADATDLEGIKDESVESISALCSLEHFGMGRYGDSINPDSWYQAIRSIVRVVSKGGHAYISVPVGWEHIEWNAHRIFFASTIVDSFYPMRLLEFSSVVGGKIEYNCDLNAYDGEKNNFGDRFGLFHFVKD